MIHDGVGFNKVEDPVKALPLLLRLHFLRFSSTTVQPAGQAASLLM